MKNINQQELQDWIKEGKDMTIIDVRTSGEIAEGMIPGAIHHDIMSQGFAESIQELDTSKTYVMVCRSGNRSASAVGFMESKGFQDVYNLTGGMMMWGGERA